mmetsp:Transcript_7627/g.14397  ORF Transcript_7627/g.14397 Transcript_7627/m.14397 type:complete len:110 (-) Transcript_7627:13872-14201(-)
MFFERRREEKAEIIDNMDNGRVMDFEDFRSLFFFPQLHKPPPLPEIKVNLVKQLSKISVALAETKPVHVVKRPPKRYISRQKLIELSKPRLSESNEDAIGHAYFRSRQL